ncbi:C-type lectin domain family 5 member A-like isoform 3-T3 [Theristicus caerulescens]
MSEDLIYADLNLTESTRPRLQEITDVQGSTYAEVKVQFLDTNAAANYTSSDHPTASRSPDSKTFFSTYEETLVTLGLVLATETGRDLWWSGENYKQDHTGCPPSWEKKGEKCYFFSKIQEIKDWNASHKECTDMDSDLVIIDSEEELNYLVSKSKGHYYLLGLKYSMSEKKWKWINNMEHSTVMFTIKGDPNYSCAVIGHCNVETAPCGGSSTTENMCEKAASISERQRES